MTVSRARHGSRTTRPHTRSTRLDALIGVVLFAAAIGIVPVIFALFGGGGGSSPSRTAFASAPAGSYAVVAKMNRTDDAIYVAPADGGEPVQIASVPHLPGYGSTGAVSPDGRHVALVTADAGTQANPGASLLLLDLETAALTRLAIGVDPRQTPVWAPDGRAVVVSRLGSTDGPATDVSFVSVAVDLSGERPLSTAKGVLGAYAVGFDPVGRFLSVAIDTRGSTLVRDGSELVPLSPQITRDWQISPDGSAIAFVEANVSGGLRYTGRVMALDRATSERSALQAATAEQSLGVAWAPGGAVPTFGREPGTSAGDQARALTLADGFDVPLAYSKDGQALAVQHWSGGTFADPGALTLQLVAGGSRRSLGDFARFYGWSAR